MTKKQISVRVDEEVGEELGKIAEAEHRSLNKQIEKALEEARGDLDHGKNDLESDYYNWACFSAQQSADKALKAVFQKLGVES